MAWERDLPIGLLGKILNVWELKQICLQEKRSNERERENQRSDVIGELEKIQLVEGLSTLDLSQKAKKRLVEGL